MQGTNSLIHNPEDKSWEDTEGEAVDSVGEDQGVENEDLRYGLDDLRSEGEGSDFEEYVGVEDEDLLE